jgi:peptide/nickel transport system permease protein
MGAAFFVRRVLYGLISLVILSVIIFVCTHLLPGDAAVTILGEGASPDALAALRTRLGLDRPFAVQYLSWLAGMPRGAFGISTTLNQPVGSIIAERFGHSLTLAGATIVVAAVLAIPLGVAAAARQGSRLDVSILTASYVGISIPDFVVAPMLIILLASPPLSLLPSSGYEPVTRSVGGWLAHIVLPVVVLTSLLMAHLLRQTRSGMLEVLSSDYIRTARLKGLPERLVLWRHGVRNGLTTTIAVLALDVGYLMGSIVIVEEIFAYPGLGRLMVYAVANRDIPLVQGTVLVIGAVYVVANLLADIAQVAFNPRLARP